MTNVNGSKASNAHQPSISFRIHTIIHLLHTVYVFVIFFFSQWFRLCANVTKPPHISITNAFHLLNKFGFFSCVFVCGSSFVMLAPTINLQHRIAANGKYIYSDAATLSVMADWQTFIISVLASHTIQNTLHIICYMYVCIICVLNVLYVWYTYLLKVRYIPNMAEQIYVLILLSNGYTKANRQRFLGKHSSGCIYVCHTSQRLLDNTFSITRHELD